MKLKKLAKIPSPILEMEMLRRSIDRTHLAIRRAQETLIALEEKHFRQDVEMARLALRLKQEAV